MTSSHDSRRRVLEAVQAAAVPLTIEDIAAVTGLHPNTVRGHIDVLLALREVERTSAGAAGRGRPKWQYQATGPHQSPYRDLAEALVTELVDVSDSDVLHRAAERWATGLPEPELADSPDEAVHNTAESLNRLGFRAEVTPVGDAITISSCPYSDLAAGNAAICEIHAALMTRLLDQSGHDVVMTRLDIHPRPGICVARLERPDLRPLVSIEPKHVNEPTRSQGASA